ncbi:MAG TPA: hypothetical protein VFR14_04570 [Candidatus Limnocylindrales bacterium]|nr:hypothetical protein [Candidatus Limnocylindrales bacterium]
MVRGRGGPRARRFFVSVVVASLGWAMLAAPVAADDPAPGDEPSTAIPIADIGIPQAYDTSAATANGADPAECNGEFEHFDGPFTNTFWHSFTAAADGDLIVDVNSFPDPDAEGFLAILFVFEATNEGAVGPLVACNAFGATVRFAASAGATYLAMTGSLPETPAGGPAEITILEPFVSNLTVSDRATYDQATKGVTIRGTVECATPANIDVSAFGSQQVGSHVVSGDGFVPAGECDGEHDWSLTLFGFNSFFNPGELQVFVEVFACTTICLGDFVDATVRARPGKPVPVEPPPPPPPPPANDEREGAFAIAIDSSAAQDTNGATANATDPGECPDQPIVVFSTATVWYSLDVTEAFVEIDTFGSDYDTTLFVLQGDTIVACNDQAGDTNQSQLAFAADGAYDIMVGAWQDSPAGNLVLNVAATDPPPPPPPVDNDDPADAIPLIVDAADPLTADTRGATADPDTDPAECPSNPDVGQSNHTVWYSIAGADGFVEVNTFGSDFDTTLFVLDGDGGVVACNDDFNSRQSRVVFEADPAVAYLVMAGSFNGFEGGNLEIRALSTDEPPPPPEPFVFTFSVSDVGVVNTRTGEVTISGTATCSREASGFMSASLFQEGGRFTADGFGEAEHACGPAPTTWTLTLFGFGSKFQAGDAVAFVDAFAFTDDGEGQGTFIEQVIRLRPAGSAR